MQVFTTIGHLVGFVCLKDEQLCFVRAADADHLLSPYLKGDGLWQSTDVVTILSKKARQIDAWLGAMKTETDFNSAVLGLQIVISRQPQYRKAADTAQKKQRQHSLQRPPAAALCQAAFEQAFNAVVAQVG